MRNLPVSTIGTAAFRILSGGGAGRVIAVFRRSFYVAFDAGLLCAGPSDFGPGPTHLFASVEGVASWRERIAVGERAEACRDGLVVGDFVFDARGVLPWLPPPPPAVTRENVEAGLARLAAEAKGRETAGLGILVGPLCGGLIPAVSDARDPVVARALPAIAALADWARRRAPRAPPPETSRLLGLGAGLTPSGDDFLGGFLVALRRLGAEGAADRLATAVLPCAAAATNAISVAHLAAAAAGEAAAALVDACDAIIDGGRDLGHRLDRAVAIGHSSGWDCLAGMTAAAAAVRSWVPTG